MQIGDQVEIHCITGMGSGSIATITDIKMKYNEDTGKPRKVICFGDHEFSALTGAVISGPFMYYINVSD
jgi:hypothetical protein